MSEYDYIKVIVFFEGINSSSMEQSYHRVEKYEAFVPYIIHCDHIDVPYSTNISVVYANCPSRRPPCSRPGYSLLQQIPTTDHGLRGTGIMYMN